MTGAKVQPYQPLQSHQSIIDAIPKEGVKEANLQYFLFDIYGIAAEGLSEASPYYAKVTVVCYDQTTMWTTPVDEEGGKNPKWNEERTIMVDMNNVHRKNVYVVVRIYKKGRFDFCVGKVRIPVGEKIDYEIEKFLLSRTKYQLRNPQGTIKLSCRIRASQVTEIYEVLSSKAGFITPKLEETVTSSVDVALMEETGSSSANLPMVSSYLPEGYLQAASATPISIPQTASDTVHAQQDAPEATISTPQNALAPATVYAQQATPVAPAFSGMTPQGTLITPLSSYGPLGGFSPTVNYQQSSPGFWYHPQHYPGYYYHPMPQQPQRANNLGPAANSYY